MIEKVEEGWLGGRSQLASPSEPNFYSHHPPHTIPTLTMTEFKEEPQQ